MRRLSPLDATAYSARQRQVHDDIAKLRNNAVSGPFSAWIHLPEIAEGANRFGDAVKRSPALPERLYRLAALVTAQRWQAQYAWNVHAPRGILAGLDADAVKRLRDGSVPAFPNATDNMACCFLGELLDKRQVSDETFAAAKEALGANTLIALVAAAGFFTCAGMTLSAFEIETD